MTTVRINLLPVAYELRYRRSLRLKRWVAVGVAVIALQIPAFIGLRGLGSHARELQRGLAAAKQQRDAVNVRLAAIALQQAEVDRQIQLAERLANKHHWSDLFASVAASLPDKAVLTRIETDPPKAGQSSTGVLLVRAPAGANATGAASESQLAGGLLIQGIALDHDTVASFLKDLNASGAVGQCSLETSQRQPFLSGEAVFFTVRTKW